MTSTITPEQQLAIATYLNGRNIPVGIGTKEAACSIAAINLALTGELTDHIPECMSPVIGQWIIAIQDFMPNDLRNSDEWRQLLPLAAGTGREHETTRLTLIMNWMWLIVLPSIQSTADEQGFGDAWRHMTTARTENAARAAAAEAARAARAAAEATGAAAERAARAARAAARAAAEARAEAARAAEAAAAEAWVQFNPCKLLQQLIEI